MTQSHTGRMLLAGTLLLGVASVVSACSDPAPVTSTTVERTTTQTMMPVQPPTTVTTTRTRQTP